MGNRLSTQTVRPTKLTGLPVEKLAKDNRSNILGAAAVLDSYADQAGLTDRSDLGK